jgi:ribosomal protein L24E
MRVYLNECKKEKAVNDGRQGTDLDSQYTKGTSFRARAEARQREYRAGILGVGWSEHGHWLCEDAVARGANFVVPEAFEAAQKRDRAGKGVGARTFKNMLSSQAMCFNLFAPLAGDMPLTARVLRSFLPWLGRVDAIHIEYTPSNEIFGDQTGLGGVDCDVLIEGTSDHGEATVVVLETKFVEPEFSVCSFCHPKRIKEGKSYCSGAIPVRNDSGVCLYESQKHYRYWQRTIELGTLDASRLPTDECPFSGPLWQLWLNHVLAHAEAARRKTPRAVFGVVAPEANDALHRGLRIFEEFIHLLAEPSSFVFIGVDAFIQSLREVAESEAHHDAWIEGLQARYTSI